MCTEGVKHFIFYTEEVVFIYPRLTNRSVLLAHSPTTAVDVPDQTQRSALGQSSDTTAQHTRKLGAVDQLGEAAGASPALAGATKRREHRRQAGSRIRR